MKRILLAAALIVGAISFGQTQLYLNTFEGAPGFDLNTTDEGGTASGDNPWVVNNEYAGGSGSFFCVAFGSNFPFTVPAAPQQPAGITNNPTSQHLHVTPQIAIDDGSPGLQAASYVAADGFCIFGGQSTFSAMNTDINTMGHDSVELDLWWMCGGSTIYYGELYWSTDGGTNWTVATCPTTGTNVWNGQNSWVNSFVSVPAWANQPTLRFGFRFLTATTSTGSELDPGFAIDDIEVTGFTVCTPTSSTITESACDQYVSPSGNYTWTTTGMHNDTIPNMAGCDSVITVDLTITTVDNNVTPGTMSLSADASGGGVTYQWLDCNNGHAVIAGATSQVYDAMNGDFAVEVTDNGCVDTSACNTIAGLGISNNALEGKVKVYPNPTEGQFFIELNADLGLATIKITNVEGKLIQKKTISNAGAHALNLEGERGVYFVEVSFDEGQLTQTYRLVKM